MVSKTEDYFLFMKREVEKLEQNKFTGNIDFKVNIKDGTIANINSILTKSIKL